MLQRVDAETKFEVEDHRSVLDEEIVLAASPPSHLGPAAIRRPRVEHTAPRVARELTDQRRGSRRRARRRPSRVGLFGADGNEADVRLRTELAKLPPVTRHDDRRTHEAAEAWSVGTENDGDV